MRFPHRKVIGQYQTPTCPFCDKRALLVNSQKIPVCAEHKEKILPERRCSCGSWLELLHGKYGPYYNCIKCGNMSFAKGTERAVLLKKEEKTLTGEGVQHTIVRSDDPRYF